MKNCEPKTVFSHFSKFTKLERRAWQLVNDLLASRTPARLDHFEEVARLTRAVNDIDTPLDRMKTRTLDNMANIKKQLEYTKTMF